MSDSTRRRVLLGAVASASTALAGCSGVLGGGSPTTDGGAPSTGGDPTTDESDGTTSGAGTSSDGPGDTTDGDPDGVYVVAHDLVRGYLPDVEQERTAGVLTNQFLPGEAVTWRIAIVDGVTGEEVGPGVIGQGDVAVTLGDGTRIEATYGNQPLRADPTMDRDLDRYYTATWEIPTDHPPGVVDYSFSVDADRPVEAVHFETEDSRLTVLDGPPVTESENTTVLE